MKKGLLTTVKVLVSLGLVVYLLRRTGLDEVAKAMRLLSPAAFFLSVALLLLSTYLCARRWHLLVPYKVGTGKIMALSFMGTFFNLCLPGIVGGDVVRGYYLSRHLKNAVPLHDGENSSPDYSVNHACAGSVFMDRCMGLSALLAFAVAVYPWGAVYLKGSFALWIVPVLASAFLVGVLLVFKLRVSSISVIGKVQEYLGDYRRKRGTIAACLAYSVVVQLITILSVMAVGHGLGIVVAPLSYFVFVPLINVLLMVPLSISGIGLREGAYAFFFGMLGVPSEKAIVLSFVWFLSQVVASLPGFLVYAMTGRGTSLRENGSERQERNRRAGSI